MKKILLTCFLGGVRLFQKAIKPIRSLPNLIRTYLTFLIKNLFRSDEGGAYFTPRYEEYISPRAYFAEGIPLTKAGRPDRRKYNSSTYPMFGFKPAIVAFLLFLGLTTSSIAKVADSPRAEERAAFAIFRGGDSRPDYSPPDIFGLVDSDQDEGLGLKASHFQSTPVPVLSMQYENQEVLESQSLESPLLSEVEESVLHLDSLIPSPVTVYFLHRSPMAQGNLIIELWDAAYFGLDILSNYQRMEVSPSKPHLLAGIMPREERGYHFRSPSISNNSLISLSFENKPLIWNFQVSPGDSVMIQVNEPASTITFTGPDAPKFRLQKELQDILASSLQETDIPLPLKSAEDLDSFLAKPGNQEAWDNLSNVFGRKTTLLVAGEPELEYLRSIDWRKWENEINKRVDFYQDKLSKQELSDIRAAALGSLGSLFVNRLPGAFSRMKDLQNQDMETEFSSFINESLADLASEIPESQALYIPDFREFLLAKAKLNASLLETPLLDRIFFDYSAPVAERLAVQYLSDQWRRIPDFEMEAKRLHAQLANASLKTELEVLLGRIGRGSPVIPFDFKGLSAQRVQSKDFEGKILLIDFWISGCGACKVFHEKIQTPLISTYGDHPDVQMISVCADRNDKYWKEKQGTEFLPDSGYVAAYAEQPIGANSFLSHYNIQSYPQWMIVRADGTLLRLGRVPASLAEAEKLIQEALASSKAESTTLNPEL